MKKIFFVLSLLFFSSLAFSDDQLDCAKWVIGQDYHTFTLRAEVAKACGEKASLDCAKWVVGEGEYSTVKSRLEAVKACSQPVCRCSSEDEE